MQRPSAGTTRATAQHATGGFAQLLAFKFPPCPTLATQSVRADLCFAVFSVLPHCTSFTTEEPHCTWSLQIWKLKELARIFCNLCLKFDLDNFQQQAKTFTPARELNLRTLTSNLDTFTWNLENLFCKHQIVGILTCNCLSLHWESVFFSLTSWLGRSFTTRGAWRPGSLRIVWKVKKNPCWPESVMFACIGDLCLLENQGKYTAHNQPTHLESSQILPSLCPSAFGNTPKWGTSVWSVWIFPFLGTFPFAKQNAREFHDWNVWGFDLESHRIPCGTICLTYRFVICL